jgi:hypothetical protein
MNTEMRIRSGSVPTQRGMDAQRGDRLDPWLSPRTTTTRSRCRAVGLLDGAQGGAPVCSGRSAQPKTRRANPAKCFDRRVQGRDVADTASRPAFQQRKGTHMVNTYRTADEADRDKAQLVELFEALHASPSVLRRNADGLWTLRGRPGCYVSTWGDGKSWQLVVAPEEEISALQWTWFKKRPPFCEVLIIQSSLVKIARCVHHRKDRHWRSDTVMATIHNLPSPAFDPVRNLLHGMQFQPRFDVLNPTTTNDQAIKTKQIVFQNSSSLIFLDITPLFLTVYADHWYFDGPFKIGYSSNLNLNGNNGPAPAPTPPTRPGLGQDGNNGIGGSRGNDGLPAPALPQIVLIGQKAFLGEPGRAVPAKPSDIQALFSFDGLRGGQGGQGGAGGNGTNGNQGEPGIDGGTWFETWTECIAGPGWGGRGGDGGVSGVPGQGGSGGDGANIFMFISPRVADIFRAANVSVTGAFSGAEGAYGPAGIPGKGGPGGQKTDGCTADRPGPDGRVPPPCRFPEQRHNNGKDGNSLVQEYDGFNEL